MTPTGYCTGRVRCPCGCYGCTAQPASHCAPRPRRTGRTRTALARLIRLATLRRS